MIRPAPGWTGPRRTRPRWPGPDWTAPVTAGIAVALSSTALAGVLQGLRWLWPVLLTIGLMVLLGLLSRARRAPLAVVLGGQLLGLLTLTTGLFSEQAVLGVLPGPTALAELAGQLGAAGGQIQGGIPPVPSTTALLVLVCLAFGLLAVTVDALTAAGHGPAACGLAMLCAFTVPATLARAALPGWTLAVGAVSYAVLLVVDHQGRLAGRSPAAPAPPAGSAGAAASTTVPVALTITAMSVAVALLAGVLATAVGTEGRFPGGVRSTTAGDDLQFGLNPFTSLRGQLERPIAAELFRVRGLPEASYLRALTLSRYAPQLGWQLPDRRADIALDRTLPSGLPAPVVSPTVTVEVENVGYRDRWLPLYGRPLGVTGVTPGRWRYDVSTGTAYTDGPVREPRWTERAVLPGSAIERLRDSAPATDVDPNYLDTRGVDPRIGQLAAALTRPADTPFERVVALNRHFLDPANGYRYSLRTVSGNTGDALLDFLVRGKVGYCEQFASAMAVMLRTVGVPARVAVGFTPGTDNGGVRSIETSDAHAWVEAYFTGLGWLTFDPTPLGDGRTVTPGYVADAPSEWVPAPPPEQLTPPEPGPWQPQSPEAAAQPAPAEPEGTAPPDPGGADQGADAPPTDPRRDAAVRAVVIGLLAVLGVAALLAAPAGARRLARRRRLARTARGGSAGAVAAWRELLAESRDRGGQPAGNDTVRTVARRLASDHRLDAAAAASVRTVVGAVERGWYARPGLPAPGLELMTAVSEVRAGLDRGDPLSLGERLWPRSLLPSRDGRPALTTRLAGIRHARQAAR